MKRKSVSIVVFGGTGDLMKRKLVPAFAKLVEEGKMGKEDRIIGIGRREFGNEEYKEFLAEDMPENKELVRKLPVNYIQIDIEKEDLSSLKKHLESFEPKEGADRIFYLAVGYSLFPLIVEKIREQGMEEQKKGKTRIVFEKPFGNDLESSDKLEKEIGSVFSEEDIFRIDHYLAKDSIILLGELKKKKDFDSILNKDNVSAVEIIADEELGAGRRAYYDSSGAIKDVIQNHLLQILSLLLDKDKISVLKKINFVSSKDNLLGQYESYLSELKDFGVKESKTETFASLVFLCEDKRWKGVSLRLRTGKKLKKKKGEIKISIKDNVKTGEISKIIDKIRSDYLHFDENKREIIIDIKSKRDEYSTLIGKAMSGEKELFAKVDEVRECWRIIEDIEKTKKIIKFVIYKDGQEIE